MSFKVGHYYRLQVDGFDDIIGQYDGKKEPRHCKTCTCESWDIFHLVNSDRIGKVEKIFEEVKKPQGDVS